MLRAHPRSATAWSNGPRVLLGASTWQVLLSVTVGIALLVAGVAIDRLLLNRAHPARAGAGAASAAGTRMGPAGAPEAVFVDRADRLSVAYPASWRRLRSGDPEVRLLAAGGGGALLVRVAPLPFEARHPVSVARDLGRAALVSSPAIRPVRSWPVRMGGLAGYAYSYLFRDSAAGGHALHLEYFLPRGSQLITIVLQSRSVRPSAELQRVFSRIVRSFRAW